ncbi:MAG: PA14 domain-containing protein [Burkholderiales bacterium]|jgi:hypothetical protein
MSAAHHMLTQPQKTKFRRWRMLTFSIVAASSLVAANRMWFSPPLSSPEKGGIAATERQYAEQRANLCGAGNAIGVGLKGDYFINPDASGAPALSRIDKLIDFDAGFDAPQAIASAFTVPRSVRWTGWIKPPLNGRYRFHFDAPGVTVTVAHQLVSGWGADPNASVDMAIGRFYPILIEAKSIHTSYTGRWRLEWTAPHGLRYLVPTALLFMPSNPAP